MFEKDEIIVNINTGNKYVVEYVSSDGQNYIIRPVITHSRAYDRKTIQDNFIKDGAPFPAPK